LLEEVDILFLASIFVDRDRQRRGYGERRSPAGQRRAHLRRLRHWRRARRKRTRAPRWW